MKRNKKDMKMGDKICNTIIKYSYKKRQKTYLSRLIKDIKLNYWLYLFVLPAVILIFIFNYIPMYGIQIAFKDFVPSKGIIGSSWVGLKDFVRSSYDLFL